MYIHITYMHAYLHPMHLHMHKYPLKANNIIIIIIILHNNFYNGWLKQCPWKQIQCFAIVYVLAAWLIHDNVQVESEAHGAQALGEAHSKSAGDTQEVKKVC